MSSSLSAASAARSKNLRESTNSDTSLAVETFSLGRRFGSRWVVESLDLKVPRGAVYGFLGLNGAGKSTTLRILMGLLGPSEGEARVLGMDPVIDDLEVKRRVGYVPDTPTFYEWMTVRETLAFIQHYRLREWDEALAARLLRDFELPANQRVDSLSRGQRARVALVSAMAFNPDVLILDEPTLGLDPLARRQFVEGLLAQYMEQDSSRTIILSSHLITEISGIVDHVGILKDGKLIRAERTEQLLESVKRVRLEFEGDAPRQAPPELAENLLSWRADGREALVALDNYEPTRTWELLKKIPARATVEDLPLEDVFIELAGSSGKLSDTNEEGVSREALR